MGYFDYWYDESHPHKITLYKTNNFGTIEEHTGVVTALTVAPFLSSWMENTDVQASTFKHHVKMIPTIRPMVERPEIRTDTIEIPGKDGVLDLSEAFTKRPTYGNRSGEWKFVIAEYLGDENTDANSSWARTQELLMNALHGKRFYIVLDDDPNYYYYGRLTLQFQDANNGDANGVVIKYDLEPAKWFKYYYYVNQVYYLGSSQDSSYQFINHSVLGQFASQIELQIASSSSTSSATTVFTFENPETGMGSRSISVPISKSVWTPVPDVYVSNITGANSCTFIKTSGPTTSRRFRKGVL